VTPASGPVRELSFDERSRWGACSTCGARHGEACNPSVGFPLGTPVSPAALEGGVHLGRLQRAPFMVCEVPVLVRELPA